MPWKLDIPFRSESDYHLFIKIKVSSFLGWIPLTHLANLANDYKRFERAIIASI